MKVKSHNILSSERVVQKRLLERTLTRPLCPNPVIRLPPLLFFLNYEIFLFKKNVGVWFLKLTSREKMKNLCFLIKGTGY